MKKAIRKAKTLPGLNLVSAHIQFCFIFGARGAADRGVESLRFPGEHCQKIVVSNATPAGQRFTWSKMWCDRQQLWKAVITEDTVTRLSIPI